MAKEKETDRQTDREIGQGTGGEPNERKKERIPRSLVER